MDTAHLVLEYLKVALGTAPVIGVVAITFMLFFRGQIGGLIDRAWKIKFPGGEVSASQQEQSRSAIAESSAVPAPTAGSEVALPNTVNLTAEQGERIVQLIKSERANAALWEYRYLNHYLVRATQLVLEWLATQPQPVSMRLVDTYLQPHIPEARERSAIINALSNHHLITSDEEVINVTAKGREYLQWRGPLPPVGAP